jgi:glycosyltransferase involved in cell wall biosynthesis
MTLVIPSLTQGGAERVLTMTANHWARLGHAVVLITLDASQNDTCPLNPEVSRVGLGLLKSSAGPLQAVWNNGTRLRSLRRAIRDSQPDVVISFIDRMNVLTLLATRGLGLDVIVSERVDPRRHDIGSMWNALRRSLYPRARALVVQTERVCHATRSLVRGKPIYVIPNAIEMPKEPTGTPPADEPSGCRIVAMGRLVPQKGFDLLIQAFAQIAAEHPNWRLHILGNGPQQSELEQLARAGDVTERVSFGGWVAETANFLRQSDLFVLSSRYEGFPNALLEAMACGLPAVSFDCDSGPAEIIRDGIDGLLVDAENVDALAEAMERLMSDEELRRRLATRAPEVIERFSVDEFFRRWECVLDGAAEKVVSSGCVKSQQTGTISGT